MLERECPTLELAEALDLFRKRHDQAAESTGVHEASVGHGRRAEGSAWPNSYRRRTTKRRRAADGLEAHQ